MKNIHILFVIIISLSFGSCNRKIQSNISISIKKNIDTLLVESQIQNNYFIGFQLYDLEENRIVYSINSDKLFTPASNLKLLTFYAIYKMLPDSLPLIKYINTADGLVFWGCGNPSFLHPEIDNELDLITHLFSSTNPNYFSTSNFYNKRFGSGWAWDDYPYSYQTQISSLPLYGNNLSVNISNDTYLASPNIFNLEFTIPQNINKPKLIRSEFENNFKLEIPRDFQDKITKQSPLYLNDKVLIELLNNAINCEIIQSNIIMPDSVKTIYSKIKKDTLYKMILQNSDNFVTEQMALLAIGEKTDSLSTELFIKYAIDSIYPVLKNRIRWVDASGLSRYNLISPSDLVYILRKIYRELPFTIIKELFPTGGKSGTLSEWYKNDTPYIYAKTGTLSNNHNISGFLLTDSGKTLAFSFMNNHFVNKSSKIKKEMERIFLWLKKNY